tara:strand:- start:1793 stop:2530 length:738 start_codon:yes stop_codon:yes gene_type:complete
LKKVVLITARSKSSRLKSKILRKIGSLRAIDILILRAEQIKLPIILATSKQRSDDKLCNYVKKNYRIKIFRGDNKNKLKRWYKCFQKYKINNAIIIDGDDIFFDYEMYSNQIKTFKSEDILSAPKDMITGLFTHILNRKALIKMRHLFNKNIDSEMIEPFIKKANLKRKFLKINKNFYKKKVRLTLDYHEDLKLMKVLIGKFGPIEKSKKIVNFLIKNRKISMINYFRENYWKKNQLNKIKSIII